MKKLILIICAIGLLSCEDPNETGSKGLGGVTIKCDLEDGIYNYDGHWHRWKFDAAGCDPLLGMGYDIANNTVVISYCTDAGSLDVSSIELSNNTCPVYFTVEDMTSVNEVHVVRLLIEQESHICLFDRDDWMEITLNFN